LRFVRPLLGSPASLCSSTYLDLEKALGKGTVQLLLVVLFAAGHLAFYLRLRRYLRDPNRRFASGRTLDLDPDYFTAEGQLLRRAYNLVLLFL
jgi:hypothetical protein